MEYPWKNNSRDDDYAGMHYSIVSVERGADSLKALRDLFPDGKCNALNVVLFSTSGIHGSYYTIEEVEAAANGEGDPEDEGYVPDLTFLVVHPRTVTLRYGNCQPRTPEDFAFLRSLRESSHAALAGIGLPEPA